MEANPVTTYDPEEFAVRLPGPTASTVLANDPCDMKNLTEGQINDILGSGRELEERTQPSAIKHFVEETALDVDMDLSDLEWRISRCSGLSRSTMRKVMQANPRSEFDTRARVYVTCILLRQEAAKQRARERLRGAQGPPVKWSDNPYNATDVRNIIWHALYFSVVPRDREGRVVCIYGNKVVPSWQRVYNRDIVVEWNRGERGFDREMMDVDERMALSYARSWGNDHNPRCFYLDADDARFFSEIVNLTHNVWGDALTE
jgi:hypothetical protein